MDPRALARSLPLVRSARALVARAVTRRRRRATAWSYYEEKLRAIERWLDASNETTNFTYELTPLNLRHLAAFVAAVTGEPRAVASRYIQELLDDRELAEHVRRTTAASPHGAVADPVARYGRRAGWYALTRITGPRLVVETGVDKGLGACVLAAALRRNALDGRPGRYIGLDVWTEAGWLLTGDLAAYGDLRRGDSLASLRSLDATVDLLIADSDHSHEHESREYEAVAAKLAPRALVLSDNAHAGTALLDFAERTGRRFLFWREEPDGHWYPGGGIGAAWSTSATAHVTPPARAPARP